MEHSQEVVGATIGVLVRWPEMPEIAFGTYWLRHSVAASTEEMLCDGLSI